MADIISLYQETSPSLDSYWRSIILFGRNVASYKFALAKSLLEIAPTSGRDELIVREGCCNLEYFGNDHQENSAGPSGSYP